MRLQDWSVCSAVLQRGDIGLADTYLAAFLAPKVALFSNIALMVAVLLWRPQGLYPVTNR